MSLTTPVSQDSLIQQLRFLANTPSYTAFHSDEERTAICGQCSGEFCNEKETDAHWCMYEALSQAASAISRCQEENAQLRSELDAYKKSGLEPCDYSAMKSFAEQAQKSKEDLSVLMDLYQKATAELEELRADKEAAIADLGTNCFGCVHQMESTWPDCPHSKRDAQTRKCLNYTWRGREISHQASSSGTAEVG